jgi:hypothetical protein
MLSVPQKIATIKLPATDMATEKRRQYERKRTGAKDCKVQA